MATYYVDTAADGDAGAGTSTAANVAWKTISKVNSSSFSAGDSILFKRGCTWRETLTVPSSGSAGSPITFGAYGTGDDPVLKGSNLIAPGTSWAAAAGWSDGATWAGNGNDTGTGNLNWRNIVPANKSTVSGTKVRITFTASTTETSYITNASIGVMTTDDVFDSAPTAILFSGNANATISAGESLVSDEVTFTFDKTKRHGIHFWENQNSKAHRQLAGTGDGAYLNWAAGTDLSQTLDITVNQMVATATYFISKLEVYSDITGVWQTALTTEPKIVFFDGVQGTNETSAANLTAAREWFWASNVLYVYAASDPDTLYTSPGIEVGARDHAVAVSAKNYVTVTGIHGTHANEHSLIIEGNAAGNTIQDCESSWSAQAGVMVWLTAGAGENVIDGNTIHDVGTDGITGHDAMSTSGHETVVSDNSIYNCWKFGIFASTNYWIIERNTIYDVGHNTVSGDEGQFNGINIIGDVLAQDDSYGQHNIVRRNLVYNVVSAGNDGGAVCLDRYSDYGEASYNVCYHLDGYGIAAYKSSNNNIYNNTIYDFALNSSGELGSAPASACQKSGILISTASHATSDNVVKNNVIHSIEADSQAIGVDAQSFEQSGLSITNNCWYAPAATNFYWWNDGGGNTLATWNALTGVGTDLNADPFFVSTVTPDFRLQATSPCRDAGVVVGLTEDYAGKLVPYGDAPDIGAYEYRSVSSDATTVWDSKLDSFIPGDMTTELSVALRVAWAAATNPNDITTVFRDA